MRFMISYIYTVVYIYFLASAYWILFQSMIYPFYVYIYFNILDFFKIFDVEHF